MDDDGTIDHHCCHDEPVRVRIVRGDPYPDTPEGRTRLTFDAWVYGVLIVLTILANAGLGT